MYFILDDLQPALKEQRNYIYVGIHLGGESSIEEIVI